MSEQTMKQQDVTNQPTDAEGTVTKSTSSLLSSLRLPDTYSATGGITQPLKPTYGKLNKHRFCRVHPDIEYKLRCLLVDDKENGETYLAAPNMAGHLGSLATAKTIRLAVDNSGIPKLIGEPDVDLSGRRNLWQSSYKDAIDQAENNWVRVEANMKAGQYEITKSTNDLGDPKWPNQSSPSNKTSLKTFASKPLIGCPHPLPF